MESMMSREKSTEPLKQVLADMYVLVLMTQNAHWNMMGPSFIGLHKLFESQYNELSGFVDEIAERIRALGDNTPASLQAFLDMTRLSEPEALTEELDALNTLHETHKKLSGFLEDHISELAEDDPATADLLTDLLRSIDKQAWMIGSHL